MERKDRRERGGRRQDKQVGVGKTAEEMKERKGESIENKEENEYIKEREEEERKEIAEGGKGNVVGVVSHVL